MEWVEAVQQLLGVVSSSSHISGRKIKLDLRVVNQRSHAVEFGGGKLKLSFQSQPEEEKAATESVPHEHLVQLALAECFLTFDIGKTGRLSLEELSEALDTLGK